jgi:hypothetical protein
MKTLTATIAIEGGSTINLIDVIEYEEKFWIVPQWLENPEEGWKSPERLARIIHGLCRIAAPVFIFG